MLWRIRFWLYLWVNRLIQPDNHNRCFNGRLNVVDLRNPEFKEAFESNFEEFTEVKTTNPYLAAMRLDWLASVQPFLTGPEACKFFREVWTEESAARNSSLEGFIRYYESLDQLPLSSAEERKQIRDSLETLQLIRSHAKRKQST